jgi:hypothetical protein
MYAPTGTSPESECSRRRRNSCRARKLAELGGAEEASFTTNLSDPGKLRIQNAELRIQNSEFRGFFLHSAF